MFKKTQKIISSEELKERYPIKDKAFKYGRDREIKDILDGANNKLLVVVGPCSLDSWEGFFEYMIELKKLDELINSKIKIVPRLFTAKPRTKFGYRGLLHENDGFIKARKILTAAINDFELSGADELLYPFTYEYFSDVISYYTIGTRSSLNQEHRFFAGGIDVAVGIKNPINGDLKLLNDLVETAKNPATFYYDSHKITSTGNPYAHAILRGYQDNLGMHLNNMTEVKVLEDVSVIIDLGHSNADKKHTVIGENLRNLPRLLSNKNIRGIMLESYLKFGRSDEFVFGQSVTDECLGFEDTKRLLLELCERLS